MLDLLCFLFKKKATGFVPNLTKPAFYRYFLWRFFVVFSLTAEQSGSTPITVHTLIRLPQQ